MKRTSCIISILLVVFNSQLTLGFRGAVFEHAEQSYATAGSPSDIIRVNLEYYQMAAKVAKSQGADVMVFPEYGIIPEIPNRQELRKFLENIPDPKVESSNPCLESVLYATRPILHTLSCTAKDHGMIIVANMGDIQPCEGQKDCPKDGAFHYNTNVVFGRNGSILAKYHKEHLFVESGMDVPKQIQDPTFETEFGRFATYICFDIVFQRITEVAHWEGVDAVLFPTMWMNSDPMYNSIQYFEAWAIGNDVTLLAANAHLPGNGTIGSGIMKGKDGALAYTFNPDGRSKLIVADIISSKHSSKPYSSMFIITRNGSQEWTDDGRDIGTVCSNKLLKPFKDIYTDYRCLERDTGNFTLIKLVKDRDSIESCNNGMCCSLHYSADEMKENFYLGINNGSFYAVNRYSWAEENCFLARCEGFKNKSCVTYPMRSRTLFYEVYLKANFSTNFIYPSVLKSGMRLVSTDQWKFQSSSERHEASISFKSSCGEKLLTVGMKGRPYDRDPPYVR